MLYITIGKDESFEKVIYRPDQYFDANYEVSWLNKELSKHIIMGIDKSTYVKDYIITSPVLGGISPRDLSTGCKAALLLLNRPELVVSGERFGDNCFHWLSKVGEVHDINITLNHYLVDEDTYLNAVITNDGRPIRNSYDLNTQVLNVLEGVNL